jgi:DNA-binding PadR family transcriptional regulator
MCALEKKGWVLRQEMTGQQYAPGSYRFTITEAGRRRLEQQE